MSFYLDDQCFCRKDGKEYNCNQYDDIGTGRMQIVGNDFDSMKEIAGTIDDCILGLRSSIKCGATEYLDKFSPFPLDVKTKKEIEEQEQNKWIKDLQDQHNNEMRQRFEDAGLPTDQIIFTA